MMMKTGNVIKTMALLLLASGCSESDYVMPTVNGDNCAEEAIAAMPQENQAEFIDACKAWEEESSFRKNRFKKSSGKSYGPSDLYLNGENKK
jgi:entry exclusion lipoprotein TrbK